MFLFPRDSWFDIISYLEAKDVISLSLTGKYFFLICEEEKIWENLVSKDFIPLTSPPTLTPKSLYADQYVKEKRLKSRADIFELIFYGDNTNVSITGGNRRIYMNERCYNIMRITFPVIKSLMEKFKGVAIKEGDVAVPKYNNEYRNGFYYDGKTFEKFVYSKEEGYFAPRDGLAIYKFPVNYWEECTEVIFFNTFPYSKQLVTNHRVVFLYDGQEKGSSKITDEIKFPFDKVFIESSFTYDNFEYFVFICICQDAGAEEINSMNLYDVFNRDAYRNTEVFGIVPYSYQKPGRSLFYFYIT